MSQFLVQEAAALRIDEIYRYACSHWNRGQADRYITTSEIGYAGLETIGVTSD
jgi:toxin ParE1/3/4